MKPTANIKPPKPYKATKPISPPPVKNVKPGSVPTPTKPPVKPQKTTLSKISSTIGKGAKKAGVPTPKTMAGKTPKQQLSMATRPAMMVFSVGLGAGALFLTYNVFKEGSLLGGIKESFAEDSVMYQTLDFVEKYRWFFMIGIFLIVTYIGYRIFQRYV